MNSNNVNHDKTGTLQTGDETVDPRDKLEPIVVIGGTDFERGVIYAYSQYRGNTVEFYPNFLLETQSAPPVNLVVIIDCENP